MSKDYLVEGAKLICVRGSEAVELRIPEGHNYDSGGRKKANCMDCVKGKNIACFGKCSKNTETGICEGFMELEEKWISLGLSLNDLKKVNGNEALDMNSILICKKGGIILPLTSGQDFDSEVDLAAFMKRYLKTMMWAIGENQFCHLFGGDPINLNTGNFVYDREDLYINGKIPLAFQRFYNSLSSRKGSPLGSGWKHNYEVKAEFEQGKNLVTLMTEDGRELKYKRAIDGKYVPLFGDFGELRELPDGEWEYSPDEKKYYFDKAGKLYKISNGIGSISFSYGTDNLLRRAMTDCGDYLDYQYSSEGRLIRVSDHTGRYVELNYSYGLLKRLITPSGGAYLYEYNEAGILQSIVTPKGVRAVINEYDGQNRVIKQYLPDGGILECSYDDVNGKTYLRDQNGTVSSYESDDRFRNRKTVHEDGIEEYEYNDQNRIISYSDKNGNKTHIGYDSRGNRVKVIDGMRNETKMVYDNRNRLTKVKMPNGAVIESEYTEDGKLKKIRKPLGDVRQIIYNEAGLPFKIQYDGEAETEIEYDEKGNISGISQSGRRIGYQYDALNRVVASIDGNGNKTEYVYNQEDDITEVVNAEGSHRLYEYDADRKVTALQDYDGSVIRREYDDSNRVRKEIGKDGGETKIKYDKKGNVAEQELPNGAKTRYKYNKQGKISSITNPLGFSTFFEYDANGNNIKIINAKKEEIIFTYDGCNRIKSRKEPDGLLTEYEYNSLGQITKQKFSTGTEIVKEYDLAGNLLKETDIYGNEKRYKYDKLGRLAESDGTEEGRAEYKYKDGLLHKIVYPDGSNEEYAYDGNRNITEWKRRSGDLIRYRYDCMNRVISILDSEGVIRAFEYDAVGNMVCMTDGNGNRTKYGYSPYGELTEVDNADGSGARYEYNQVGKLLSVSQRNGNIKGGSLSLHRLYTYEYDLLGQVKSIADADGNKEYYEYDELGRVAVRRDKEGYETAYSYGSSGMTEQILYGDGRSVKMSYTPLRLLDEMEDWLGKTKFARDGNNRLEKVIDHRGLSVGYEYGSRGECNAIVYPDGNRIRYDYNESMKLARMTMGDQHITYHYNSEGLLSGKRYSNGMDSEYGYDSAGRLETIVHKNWGEVTEKYHYIYDRAGNKSEVQKYRRGIAEDSGTFRYEYDAMNRLTGVYQGRKKMRGYEYDWRGNRTKKWEGEEETDYFYDMANRLCAEKCAVGQTAYTYDGRGNLSSVCRNGITEKSFFFSAQNRLEEVRLPGGGYKKYVYNGFGHRVREETEEGESWAAEFIVDQTKGYHNLLQKDMQGTSYKYAWDENIAFVLGECSMFALTDEAGSPLKVIARTGKELKSYVWDEFGNGVSKGRADGFDFAFAGYIQDEVSGTLFAQAREYMPEAGRFISEDFVGGFLMYPLSFNKYVYCSGNPLIFIDLTGLMDDWVKDMLEKGTAAHKAVQYEAMFVGVEDGWVPMVEVYIKGGLEKTESSSDYFTPTGNGRADIVFISNGVAEVYEIKPNTIGSMKRGKKQLARYEQAMNSDEMKKRYGYKTAVIGSSLNEYFNNVTIEDPYNPNIYYELSINKSYPGVILYTRKNKALEKVKRVVKVLSEGKVKEKVVNFFQALEAGLAAGGLYMLGSVLILDDATVVGVADDALAVACIASATYYLSTCLNELEECFD